MIKLEQAKTLAQEWKEKLEAFPGVETAYIVGSVRRGNKPEVKDVDMVLVTSADQDARLKVAEGIASWGKRDMCGANQVRTVIGGVLLDIWFAEPKHAEATVLFATGSMQHNLMMRGIAKAKGYGLNRYGLFNREDKVSAKDRKYVSHGEREIFKILSISWVTPEAR